MLNKLFPEIVGGVMLLIYTSTSEKSWNADSPISVTLLGTVILVRPEQYANAPSPILVTLFGIAMLVRFECPLNAYTPIS